MDCSKCVWPSADTCKVCKQDEADKERQQQIHCDTCGEAMLPDKFYIYGCANCTW